MIAGGVESISQHPQPQPRTADSGMDPWIVEHKPELYMSMIETADIVARATASAARRRTASRRRASARPPRRKPRAATATRSCR
jgi:acetyl-CoA C-acetyltransferase